MKWEQSMKVSEMMETALARSRSRCNSTSAGKPRQNKLQTAEIHRTVDSSSLFIFSLHEPNGENASGSKSKAPNE